MKYVRRAGQWLATSELVRFTIWNLWRKEVSDISNAVWEERLKERHMVKSHGKVLRKVGD